MKFVLIHHGPCEAAGFHYLIDRMGAVSNPRAEGESGIFPSCIDVQMEGDFDAQAPTAAQLKALQDLLSAIKRRYPHIALGGHRQVRGAQTRCPGARFPLSKLRRWAEGDLVRAVNEGFEDEITRQYRPFGS